MNSRRVVSLGCAVLSLAAVLRAQAPSPDEDSLTLSRAVALALARAPELSAARAARDVAAASADLARDVFHPSAWLTTTPGYTHGIPGLVAGRVPAVAGVEIRQVLFDTVRRSDALQAEATASAIDASFAQSCRATAEAAVQAYARCVVGDVQVEVARRRVEAAESLARRAEDLAAEGRRTSLDVDRATLRAARARQKLLNAESDRDLDRLELKRLIGWPASAPLRLAEDPDSAIPAPEASENLAAARAADPEIRALGQQVALLGRAARLESKTWAPVIEASAGYQRLSRSNDYDKYYLTFTPDSVQVGVSIGLPLWTGGRHTDGARRARARLAQAEAELAQRESEVDLAVRRAEALVARSVAENSLSRRSFGIAEQASGISKLLVEEGRAELDEIGERAIEMADADEEAARARLTAFLERARLLSLRGELAAAILGAEPPCPVR